MYAKYDNPPLIMGLYRAGLWYMEYAMFWYNWPYIDQYKHFVQKDTRSTSNVSSFASIVDG